MNEPSMEITVCNIIFSKLQFIFFIHLLRLNASVNGILFRNLGLKFWNLELPFAYLFLVKQQRINQNDEVSP